MKTLTFVLALVLLASCSRREVKEITRYSVDQLSKNIIISGGGGFSEDVSRLLFSSNESGIFNVYEVTIADGSQRQMTNSPDESFIAIDYVPGTGQILYSADKGGNEIDHIYLLDEDGTSIDLTPGEREKASFYGWSKDKTCMYYGSNVRDPRFFMPAG